MPHDPPHDPPVPDVLDEPLVAVKINETWMSHVMGLFSQAASQDYWASDQVRGEDSAIAILDLMAKGNAPVFDTLSAHIRRTTNQAIAHNVLTKVVFDTALWDVGGLFDSGAGELVLSANGIWACGAGLRWQSNAVGIRRLNLFLVGEDTILSAQHDNPVTFVDQWGSVVWNITTAPVTLRVRVKQTSGASLNIQPVQEWSIDVYGHYLGPLS